MKKALLCMLLLFVPQFVEAKLLPINFTGVTAQLYDSPGYVNYGTTCYDLVGQFGGSPARNVRGQASQFTVENRTLIQTLLLDLRVLTFFELGTFDPVTVFMANFDFVFYDQTINAEYSNVIPNTQNELIRSDSIEIYGEGVLLDVASGNLHFWLNPGTYWVGFEGDPSPGVCYGSNLRMDGRTAIPEPASIFLLGFGLPFIYRKRKSRVS